MRFGSVITAAGRSVRMGAFKPLLPLGNSTFIERIINTLREGGVEKITVVIGRDASLIEEALAGAQVSFIHNKDYAVTDMFYSASLGLRAMTGQAEGIFFTPVDIPLFSADTVRQLALGLRNGHDHLIIPHYQGKSGHPIVIRSCAVETLISRANQAGLRGAINDYPGPKAALEVEDSGILYDADTPEDYRFLVSIDS